MAAGTGDVLAYGTRDGMRRVAEGDLRVRVPVVGSDETDRLAGSFNRMVAGLEERERLREAFGAAAQGLTSPAKMTGSSALSSS